MPRKRSTPASKDVGDYRHDRARRRNNPPAGLAPTYEVRQREVTPYAYDPHLDPQLVWAGKAEHTSFDVDVVSLHIHERISTRAILDAVRRPQPVQPSLFGETPLPADQQVEFYQHDVNWANRLILGDSLLVMNSLLVKEGLAGKVQMIYLDPPYGINYRSNFQPRTDRRDVKDRDDDLTHEPEQIKAYRDTWKLGIHSWLAYLRDRLLLAHELLTETGSMFVQINDENLHLAKALLDEVFGPDNCMAVVTFSKSVPLGANYLPGVCDYLLWYAKDVKRIKFRRIFRSKAAGRGGAYNYVELADRSRRAMTSSENRDPGELPDDARPFFSLTMLSAGRTESCVFPVDLRGRQYRPGSSRSWKTNPTGMDRLVEAERLMATATTLRYVLYLEDYPVRELTNVWTDTGGASGKVYAVQTSSKVVRRCMLMTTDPGDLVFDPTCGSGTTAYVAEQWGRRWITCDTSRVALAIARQRLMTARYEYYGLADPEAGPGGGFVYKTVPHVTLRSIAQNVEIDAIAARHQPDLDAALAELNAALGKEWRDWEVPRDAPDGDAVPWPTEASQAHARFWEVKRRKQAEIDASIARNAPQETLYDQPEVVRGVVRVSGPFTVEAIPVPAVEDPSTSPIPQYEEGLPAGPVNDRAGDYIGDMIQLLSQQGGVLFPGGKKLPLQNLRPVHVGYLHAEGETPQNGDTLRVALSFGPQHGPLAAYQVQEAIPTAKMNGYAVLILAGFAFDPEAQALIQRSPVAGLQIHFAHIAPDVLVGDLLKTNRASQVFTVFGQPDVAVTPQGDAGAYVATLRGVDIYDPLTGETEHADGHDVAAWFLDTDYDGQTFHICQAFFPGDGRAWQRLQRALKARIDRDAFHQMRGTVSFPFEPGKHRRVAVKVIDFRGNEVVRVIKLEAGSYA